MFNRVILVGYLGADPDIRTTRNDDVIANYRIATSKSWKDRDGERQEHTEWHSIVVFNKALAAIAEEYLKKGQLVLVEGELITEKWEDKDGNERYTTKIAIQSFGGTQLMLGGKGENGGGNGGRRRDKDEEEDDDDRRSSRSNSRGNGRSNGRSDDRRSSARSSRNDDDNGDDRRDSRSRGRDDDEDRKPPRKNGNGSGKKEGSRVKDELDDEIPFVPEFR